jgi:hypothetical protein
MKEVLLQDESSPRVVIDRERITADCVRGFGFLAELTEDERSVAQDQFQLRGVDGKAFGGEPTHWLETYGALDPGTRRSSLAAIQTANPTTLGTDLIFRVQAPPQVRRFSGGFGP